MAKSTDRPRLTDADVSLLLDAAMQAALEPQPFRLLWQQDPAKADSACLTMGFPPPADAASAEPAVARLVWWPQGICAHRRVAVISSRVGAKHHELGWWFDLLRTAVLRVRPESDCLMCVEGTTTHEMLHRACELFGIPRLEVTVCDATMKAQQLVDWLQTRLSTDGVAHSATFSDWKAEVLPRLETDNQVQPATEPLRDRLNVMLAQRCYALSIRDGGHLHGLLKAQRVDSTSTTPLVFLAAGEGASADVQHDLLDRGAIAWLVEGVATADSLQPDVGSESAHCDDAVGPLTSPDDWLCHWTRPCAGEWPGQSRMDYLDELLLGCATKDRSALAALLRIVSRAEIVASRVRGTACAVSFTEVPLHEFRSRRVYRRHRRRYDFEAWGVAVRRDSLEQLGARPVHYGAPNSADPRHSDGDLWYQPATDQSGKIDWRAEREWRLPANLDLNELPTSSVCVFVNSPDELGVVRSACHWQVILVPAAPKKNKPPT